MNVTANSVYNSSAVTRWPKLHLDGHLGTFDKNLPLQMWSSTSPHVPHPDLDLTLIGDHNYCRNPDKAEGPW